MRGKVKRDKVKYQIQTKLEIVRNCAHTEEKTKSHNYNTRKVKNKIKGKQN